MGARLFGEIYLRGKPAPTVTANGFRPSSGELEHRIGPGALIVFYVTSVVGAGILFVPGLAAHRAGPASLVVWASLALASFPIALMFAEMSARRPDCGGIAALIRSGLGTTAGATASLSLVIAYVLTDSVLGIASSRHLCDLLALDSAWVKPIAAGFMLLAGGLCVTPIATVARVQGVVLIALIACLAGAVALAVPAMSAARMRPFAPHGWAPVGAAAPLMFFSFIGWENASTVAEEVRNPEHSFHRALCVAIPVVAILYLSVTAAFLAVPSADSILVMPTLLRGSVGAAARPLGDLIGLGIIMLTTNAWVFGASRLVLGTARAGLLPAALARRSSRTGSPISAVSALVVAYLLVIGILAALKLDESYAIGLATAMFLVLYLAAACATLRDRPTRAALLSALATGAITVLFLPFTGWALPFAVLLALAIHIGSRGMAQRLREHWPSSTARLDRHRNTTRCPTNAPSERVPIAAWPQAVPTLVVGYDGSDSARAALVFAVHQAGTRGRVFIVHAYKPPPDFLGWPYYDRCLYERRNRGEALLRELPLETDVLAGPEYESELIGGPPAKAIADVAHTRRADQIVIGTRGIGRIRARRGSVSHRLLHVADRPVVIIPARRSNLPRACSNDRAPGGRGRGNVR